MKQARKRLTYANVMSTIGIFLVLGGATAFAAGQLGKNSVGSKQLKKNSVTAAKIKKNAVTKAKIKNGSVNGAKLADGSVSGSDINLGSTPFSRIIAKFRGTATIGVPTTNFAAYPLSSTTYTQGAEELNSYSGAINVSFSPSCTIPRSVTAIVSVDPKNPAEPAIETEISAAGIVQDKTGGNPNQRIELGPYLYLGTKFEPGTATPRTVQLSLRAECKTGSGVTASNGAVDVIGTK